MTPSSTTSPSGSSPGSKKLRTADPTLEDTEVGPLIIPREADRVAELDRRGGRGGAKLVTGGEAALARRRWQPAVLDRPRPRKHAVSREEVFGPVVNIYR